MSAPPGQPVAERPEEAELAPCPRCGAGVDGDQEYCLECGVRLPRNEGLPARLGDAWKSRLSWYPGDWLWPVLTLLVIACAGAAAAIASTERQQSTQPAVLTSPATTPAVTVPTAPEPTLPATTAAQVPTKKPKPRPRPGPTAGLTAWPAGASGYTLILSSIPKQAGGLAKAVSEARKARSQGLTQVGVLNSDGFSSLHPGYWVVFSGIDGSYSQANARLARAHAAGYGAGYPRRVTR